MECVEKPDTVFDPSKGVAEGIALALWSQVRRSKYKVLDAIMDPLLNRVLQASRGREGKGREIFFPSGHRTAR